MLRLIQVQNWQSLTDVDVACGAFTVITGPSSSGKSAFLRALRSAMLNPRGTRSITHGKTSSVLRVEEDAFVLTLERGATGAKYSLAQDSDVQTFTKIAGAVPDAVAACLQVSERNFADQFDRPYLLTETGSSVAQTMGDLTGASAIFEAAAESQRRRQGVANTLKVRRSDLEGLKEQLSTFAGLSDRVAQVEGAERVLSVVESASDLVGRLRDLIGQAVAPQVIEAPESLETTAPILAAAERLSELLDAARGVPSRVELEQTQEQVALVRDGIAQIPVCPTCGQEVAA